MDNRRSSLERRLASPDYCVLYGSQLYGTSTPESDRDERGFVVPPFEYLAGLCRFDQRVETKAVDRVIWSLAKFVSMLIKGDPQAYEMLCAPEDKILACSDIGSAMRDARELFPCRRFYRRILGYAQSEWRKVCGVQLKPIRRMPAEEDVINDIREVFRPEKNEMDEVIRLLFLSHKRELVSAKRKLGAKRKLQIERHGFCTSSASHSIRLLGESVELMLTGKLTFPRPDAARLIAIKQGLVSYTEAEEEFKQKLAEAEDSAGRTDLPDKPDTKAIERLYHALVSQSVLSDERITECRTARKT